MRSLLLLALIAMALATISARGQHVFPSYTGGHTEDCENLCEASWKTCGKSMPVTPTRANVDTCWSVYLSCLSIHCTSVESPRTLGITFNALIDAKGKTDIFMDMEGLNGASPPQSVSNGRVRDYNFNAVVKKSNTFQNVALTLFGSHSTGSVGFSGYSLYDWLEMKLQMSCSSFSTITGMAQVLMAPDLAVASFNVPSTLTLNVQSTFDVVVKELNGEFGAMTNVKLYRSQSGGTQTLLDSVNNVNVQAGGTTTVQVKHTPTTKGSITYKVVLEDITPKDYDSTNNSQKVSSTVSV